LINNIEKIESFFKHYATLIVNPECLNELAEQYCVPCQMLSQEQLVFVMTNDQLRAQLQQMVLTLNEMKVADVRIHHLQFKSLNEHITQVSLQWLFFANKSDEVGHEFFDFSATYLLSHRDEKLSIASVVSHEENQRGDY
jgi:hypothetical protein